MIHVEGDATLPIREPAYIAHVCNDIGAWGSGFVLAVSKRWPEPEKRYHDAVTLTLGVNQYVPVAPGLTVVNMIAQRGINRKIRAVSYDALDECLSRLFVMADAHKMTVHMPRIGAGLGGGSWPVIEALIKTHETVDTYIYTL